MRKLLFLPPIAIVAFVAYSCQDSAHPIKQFSDDDLGTYAEIVERDGFQFLAIGETEIPWTDQVVMLVRVPSLKFLSSVDRHNFPVICVYNRVGEKDMEIASAYRASDGHQVFP